MNTQRLVMLRDMLAALPAELTAIDYASLNRDDRGVFDMGYFLHHTREGAPHLDANGKPGCGTACCALGYAALRPEFQELGLGYSRVHQFAWMVTFEELDSFNAASVFFDIKNNTVLHLFDPEQYMDDEGDRLTVITPAMVAERITDLLAQGEGA